MRLRRLTASLFAVVVLVGCRLEHTTGAPEPAEAPGRLLAGASAIDITPPPGYPLAGHSIDGGRAIGVWTRLQARAIYLEDPQGAATVLVSCDLWGISGGLGDRVTQIVQSKPGLARLGRGDILLTATHTHHGPGGYTTERLYTEWVGPEPGHDPALYEFLAQRIALAIAEAAASREPANVRLASRRIGGLVRNRALIPFASNPEAKALVEANRDHPGCARPGEPLDRCHAVDPSLTTLMIRAGAGRGRPIAVAAFFAVHPTALMDDVDLYQSDLFGVAAGQAEAHFQASGSVPVVAIFNGAEGDVSPAWSVHGRSETQRLGRALGAAIIDAASTDSDPLPIENIENRFARVDVRDQPVTGGRTAKHGFPGQSILGGAEDGRTPVYRPPPGKPSKREHRPGQGAKKPAILPFWWRLGFPDHALAHEVPISIHTLGPIKIAGLPGEFTTIAGARIRRRIDAETVLLAGLAGAYLSYVTTPEEYAHQYYEGGSTLYGPHTAAFFADALGALDTDAGPGSMDGTTVYRPGAQRPFWLRRSARGRRLLAHARERIPRQLELPSEGPAFEFETRSPSAPDASSEHWPTASLERRDDQGRWVAARRQHRAIDHRGDEFVTWVVDLGSRQARWILRWIGAPLASDTTLRIRVRLPGGRWRCSEPFKGVQVGTLAERPCRSEHEEPPDTRDQLG